MDDLPLFFAATVLRKTASQTIDMSVVYGYIMCLGFYVKGTQQPVVQVGYYKPWTLSQFYQYCILDVHKTDCKLTYHISQTGMLLPGSCIGIQFGYHMTSGLFFNGKGFADFASFSYF